MSSFFLFIYIFINEEYCISIILINMRKHCIEYINKNGNIVKSNEGRKDLIRCLKWYRSNNKKPKISYSKNTRRI